MLVFSMLAIAQVAASRGAETFGSSTLLPSRHIVTPISSFPSVPVPTTVSTPTLLDFFAPPPESSPEHSSSWGDSIHEDPGDLHRVFFQNLDGLRNNADDMDLYVYSMAQFQTSTFCWADHGLALSQLPVSQALHRPIISHFGRARSACSYSALPPGRTALQNGYQPGGTFTATTGKWVSRSSGKPITDPSGLGRWSGLCFLGKRGRKLAILTAYRSPRQQPGTGCGFYDQQYALLLSRGVKKPNVRKQFITDLTSAVNQFQADGFEIILSLDANETNGQEKADGIDSLIESCTLHDLHCLTAATPPETYKYGKHRRIDYMLGSEGVKDVVRRAGYLAYDNGVFSKHRGLFVDIDFQALLGAVDPISPPAARGINSEDQPSVDRYIEAFNEYIKDHNLRKRVSELVTNAPFMPPQYRKDCYDAIDRDVTRGMLHAEKLAKKPSGKYAWSPKLREAGLLARYWHLRLREAEKGSSLSIALARLMQRIKSLNIVFDAHVHCTDIPELKLKWNAAQKLLRTVRDKAFDYRAVHLRSSLEQYSNLTFADDESGADENKTKIARIRRLINIENMRKPFRCIKSQVSPIHGGGLSKLFVPSGVKDKNVAAKYYKEDGSVTRSQLIQMAQSDKHSVEYKTLLDADEIELELLRYNHDWFRQAADTPFGHGELYDMLGYSGLTEEAHAVAEGDCIAHLGIPMSHEVQTFLEECRRPDNVPSVDPVITCKDFVESIKSWKEKTSTSPSGRHLGHYRTAILDRDLVSLHTDLLNIPITYGFAPERWTHSVTPLIEKDDGLPYLTRLRVIHLFEADYNLFLKIVFGRRMVKNAEQAEALNDQQHGSRPRRMTTDALFLSRLSKDLIRQLKSNSAHMDNDATGCYDRIVTSLGMLACRRLGVPRTAIACQANVLQNMRYAVKQLTGISSNEYFGTLDDPLFGTGQGSGASPAIWLALVVILLNCLDRLSNEEQIPGLSFTDPWEEFEANWRVGAFVDDTNQGVMDPFGLLSLEELTEQMRRAGQLWETLLNISGGCLNLAKCSWTVQHWQWIKGRPSLSPMKKSDPPLLMTSGTNPEHHIIRQHPNEKEVKGLGVFMNFHGTFAVHAQTMRFKFDGLARRLSKSSMSSILSRVYYNTFYLPAVRYSLPATSMTAVELHRVQSLMTATILNKLGYNRHYPHSVAFAPSHQFGVGLIDLRIEQGLTQAQSLLDYIGTDHKIGRVMLISLRHLQVEAGVSFDLLSQPATRVTYLTDCWLVSLRKFCAEYNVSFKVMKNRIPTISRIDDQLLMDVALTMSFSRQELVDLNLIRIYLRATTVSDIASADGRTLHSWTWRGLRIPNRNGRFTFPRQEAPTPYQCGLWRKLLRTLLQPDATSKQLCLSTPLGPWVAVSTSIWGAHTYESNLYRQDPMTNNGERHLAIYFPRQILLTNGSQHTYFTDPPDWYSATLPALAVPADLTGTHIFQATSATVQYDELLPPPDHFCQWIDELPPAEKRVLSSISYDMCDAQHLLLQYLQLDCTLFIGTDGGKKHHSGSYSWILCSPGREQMMCNAGPVDGWFRCQSSLRSEAAAISSFTLFIDEFATWANSLIHCKFHFFVDSTSAISNVKLIRDLIPKRRYPNNADLLSVMRSAHHIVSHYQLEHVKSHQDDKIDFEDLPFSAQLNVLCDEMATDQLKRQRVQIEEQTQSCPLAPRNLPVEVRYGSQVISSHYISKLRDCIGMSKHRGYLQAKYMWNDQVWATVAWDSFEFCASRPTLTHTVTRSKLVHNWLNLGCQRKRIGQAKSSVESRCPYCDQDEDFVHMLTCAAPRALKFRYEALQALNKTIASTTYGSALFRAVKAWLLDPATTVEISAPTVGFELSINRALASQESIGWMHLFRGFVSIDWGCIYSVTDQTPAEERSERAKGQISPIIMALQDFSIHIWKSRNTVLHEAGSQGLESVHASLNADICQLYAIRDTFAPIIQSYFTTSLEDRLRTSPRQRQRWLNLTQLATAHSSAKGSRQAIVPSYFPHARPTETRTPATVPDISSASILKLLVPPHQISITSFLTSHVTPS